MKTLVLEQTVKGAPDIIRRGGIVAVPTETIYGLAADALNESAVKRVFAVKGRAPTKPISIFVTDMEMAARFCSTIPDIAYRLADAFWPGPLTIVLERKKSLSDTLTAGGNTIGIRCPDNALTLALLRDVDTPLTGTSANISGMPGAVAFEDVIRYFDGEIDCAIDGGICIGGTPSTILDLTLDPPKILRSGGVSRDALERVMGTVGIC